MRIIVVVGARPNFIKVGPLMPTLRRAGIDADLAHTGQHYDKAMSDVFFSDLDIPEPRWNLGVGSGTHAVQTGSAMMRLEELFTQEKPDAVMVVGDVSFAAVSDALGDLQTTLRREVNPTVYGPPEFTEKISTPFIASVMKKPKVFLIGDEDELARLAR